MRGLLIHVRQHNFAQFAQRTLFLERAAKALNLQVEDVQKLISVGQLKLVDTFVTDRAFEEFCRRHGTAINMALIDASTRKWSVSEYGIPDHIEEKRLPRAQKHALIVRACKCGKKIAGNVFFRHVRHCRFLNDTLARPRVSKETSHTLTVPTECSGSLPFSSNSKRAP